MTKRILKVSCAVCILVFGMIIFILFIHSKKAPLRDYYERNRDTLEQLYENLFALKEDGKTIYIRGGDDYQKYGENTSVLLTRFFSQVACDSITVSTTWDGLRSCNFSEESKTKVSGMVYVEGGSMEKNVINSMYSNVFPGTTLTYCEPLPSGWIYYEALPYEMEKKLAY